MLMLLVEVEVKRELLAEFTAAIRENAARSVVNDRGCRRFDVYVDEEAPTMFVLHEVYDDEAAWQGHRESPHFHQYQEVADRALVSRRLRRLKTVDASSSVLP